MHALPACLSPVTDAALLRDVRDTLLRLWNKPAVALPHNFQVPCTNPCSIMRADLGKLRARASTYRVGLKTDGTRFYLLCGFLVKVDTDDEEEYMVLVDRSFHVYRFPASGSSDLFEGTLLDGELVARSDGTYEYVVFDAVAAKGYLKKDAPHRARMQAAANVLQDVCAADVKLSLKQWSPLSDAVSLFNDNFERGAVKCDGLILVPNESPLQAGTQPDLYKWKPAHMHTIDFVYDGHHLMAAMFGKCVVYFEAHQFEFDGAEEDVPRDVVIECACTRPARGSEREVWKIAVKGTRVDKPQPNDVRVVNLTVQNILEAMRVDELVPV
jgi:hypothetical protein